MKYNLSNKMSTVKFSAIRTMNNRLKGDDAISFAGGFPDPEAIPQETLKEFSKIVFDENTLEILKYGNAPGYTNLIESSKDFMNSIDEGTVKDSDDVLITTGSMQGLDIVSKLFINEGETMIVEDPSFLGAFNSFKCNGAVLHGVPLEDDGVNIDALEAAFSIKPTPKLFYIIPNFQNPSGVTTSLEKRKKIYELAKKYGVVILEDNPYGYLRTSGESLPSIKSMDTEGIVVYVASLSKIISPGMRIGLLVCDKEIYDKMKIVKSVNDNHTNLLSQYIMDRFLRTVDMDKHIHSLRDIYAKKCHFMLEMMETHFHPSITYVKPEGGMFIWAKLPDHVSMPEFVEAAIQRNVAIVPGNEFMVDTTAPCQYVRINFSTPSLEQIERGIKILGEVSYEYCGELVKS